jgi:hydroxymethylpyrimidine/phosphomethylpyrimidine kinase
MTRALTIAASDSCVTSGAQADLKVFDRCGVYGTCAVTTIAAQDTFTVRKVYKLPASIVGAQIDAAVLDVGADACKVGWYRSAELTTVIAGRLRRREVQQVVVDPCLWSERGEELTRPRTVKRMVRELLPVVQVLTLTRRELAVFAGGPVETAAEVEEAARQARELGPAVVVVEDAPAPEGLGVLVCDEAGTRRVAEGMAQEPLAGAGSIFSAALTAALARGESPAEGTRFAAEFVAQARRAALPLGKGLPVALL